MNTTWLDDKGTDTIRLQSLAQNRVNRLLLLRLYYYYAGWMQIQGFILEAWEQRIRAKEKYSIYSILQK